MQPLRVKICGITRIADALFACELGAEAVGFIFYKKSSRYIPPEVARKIASALPGHVARVGVFVSPPKLETEEIASIVGLDVLQIHGRFTPEDIRNLPDLPRVGAFNIDPTFDFSQFEHFQNSLSAFLLDGYKKGEYGGTGATLDWKKARIAAKRGKIVLAGGLSPENVREAVLQARPYAIDVNSGVESAPGVKDHQKLEQLFHQIKDFRRERYASKNDKKFPLA